MAHNPYSAPTSKVADVSAEPPMERPRAVVIAVIMLWTELVLGVLDSTLDWKNTMAREQYMIALGFEAVFAIISIWLNYKIWQGRNWARIVALALTALTALSFAPALRETFSRSALVGTLFCIELLLDIAAMYLVFFPGRRWFARR